jgi:phage baseplate assembly protein W
MAYNVQRINPLDLQPRKAVGVALPFQGRAVFNSTYTTKDATKANLINFFLTGQNERVFNVDFGAGLRNFVFEAITQDSVEEITERIETSLKLYFPQVQVKTLKLTPEPDQNLISFELKYSVRETNITDEIVINFEQ